MSDFALLPQVVIISYVFIFGICTGSFLNVAILRGLTGENMVFERSHCPKCLTQLKWYMNIPLLSYIFLRGKCAFCKTHISFQYPLVEFICGLCFVFSYLAFGLTLKTLFICIFLSIFILLSATDFKETVILDYHAYILLAVGLLYSFLKLGDVTIVQSIIGAIGGFLILEIIARCGYFFVNHRIFGEGDSLIALGLGAIFGLKVVLLVFALSALIQSISVIPIMIKNTFNEKKYQLSLSYVLVFFGVIAVFAMNYFKFIKNDNIYLLVVILISLSLIYSLKNIINELKNKKNIELTEEEQGKQYSLMPFGPALIFASILCIFYLPEIKKIFLSFLG